MIIDGDRLMMSLADWWFSSFGEDETEESKAIKAVMDKVEESLKEFTVRSDQYIFCRECKHNRSSPEAGNANCELFYGMNDQEGWCYMAEERIKDEQDQ